MVLAELQTLIGGIWPTLVWGGAIFSVLALLSTFIGLPMVLTRLPPDYLIRDEHPSAWGAARVARNMIGWVLLILGVLMLVLPGQGLLTMLAGLVLVDLPGKRRWIRMLLTQGPIRRTVAALRARAGAEPLQQP